MRIAPLSPLGSNGHLAGAGPRAPALRGRAAAQRGLRCARRGRARASAALCAGMRRRRRRVCVVCDGLPSPSGSHAKGFGSHDHESPSLVASILHGASAGRRDTPAARAQASGARTERKRASEGGRSAFDRALESIEESIEESVSDRAPRRQTATRRDASSPLLHRVSEGWARLFVAAAPSGGNRAMNGAPTRPGPLARRCRPCRRRRSARPDRRPRVSGAPPCRPGGLGLRRTRRARSPRTCSRRGRATSLSTSVRGRAARRRTSRSSWTTPARGRCCLPLRPVIDRSQLVDDTTGEGRARARGRSVSPLRDPTLSRRRIARGASSRGSWGVRRALSRGR